MTSFVNDLRVLSIACPPASPPQDGYTALLLFAGRGRMEACVRLAELGADVNFIDEASELPLLPGLRSSKVKFCVFLHLPHFPI